VIIKFNKLNDKYRFYTIIIFDPVTGEIIFNNDYKYLYVKNSDEDNDLQMVKSYHFGCDIIYYKKRINSSFLKGVYYPFVSSNFSHKPSTFYNTTSVLAIPATLVDYKFIDKVIVHDDYKLSTNVLINATISLYVNDDEDRTCHVIKTIESKNNYTERGLLVKKVSEYLYSKHGHSYEVNKLYEIIRSIHDKEIQKELSILIRDLKINDILS
jgi:hypothetical protein